tara:strand:+ start:1226 stop:1513 length:288 start_codon:yes stop_codon:yes gene_type:complete
MTRVKKKPTMKEMTNVVIELNSRVNAIAGYLQELEKALSLYIDMNKHGDKFTKFIDKKVKEYNDAKADAKPDNADISGDTEDPRSGSERVREKAK